MILILCPHCGPRNSSEFSYLGERKSRPSVAGVSQQEWREYLYLKQNPAGWTTEQWFHGSGCRKYFFAERHTTTNEIRATWLPGAAPPSDGSSA
jgi:heterotetrameric sarcosine oxidase delta subunit